MDVEPREKNRVDSGEEERERGREGLGRALQQPPPPLSMRATKKRAKLITRTTLPHRQRPAKRLTSSHVSTKLGVRIRGLGRKEE